LNLEFIYFEYFYETATCGNITLASQKLHITQPALSKDIANLESIMQCKLFTRSVKGVSLTDQGSILYEAVKQSYVLLNNAKTKIKELSDFSVPEINIAAGNDLTSFVVLPWLKMFRLKYPDIIVKILEARSLDIIEAIKSEEVELGLSHTKTNDSTLEFYNLFNLDYCFVVGDKYQFLSGPPSVPLQKLIDFPIILFPSKSVKRQHIDSFFKNQGLVIKPAYEAGNTHLLMQFAESNMGIALVPRNFAEQKIKSKKLFEVDLIERIPQEEVWLVWKKSKELSHFASKLMLHIKEQSKQICGGLLKN